MAKRSRGGFFFAPDDFGDVMEMLRPQVVEAAGRVRDSAESKVPDDVPVTATESTGNDGRPVVLVTIAHPSGLPRQAKDGVLTRSAAESGLEVTRHGGD